MQPVALVSSRETRASTSIASGERAFVAPSFLSTPRLQDKAFDMAWKKPGRRMAWREGVGTQFVNATAVGGGLSMAKCVSPLWRQQKHRRVDDLGAEAMLSWPSAIGNVAPAAARATLRDERPTRSSAMSTFPAAGARLSIHPIHPSDPPLRSGHPAGRSVPPPDRSIRPSSGPGPCMVKPAKAKCRTSAEIWIVLDVGAGHLAAHRRKCQYYLIREHL